MMTPETTTFAEPAEQANGAAPVEIKAAGPQIKRRTAWIDLPKEYEGFKFEVWLNAPTHHWTDLMGGTDEEVILSAVKTIFLQHNGWLDFDGNPYPQTTTNKFWEQIPNELMALMIIEAQNASGNLAASRLRTRKRSRRG